MMETPPPSLSAAHEHTSEKQPVDTEQLLSLLGDEYTRAIVDALGTESLPARDWFELSLGDQPDTPADSPDGTGSSGSPITLSVHAD